MKNFVRIAALMLMMVLLCPVALAAKATPTPPPVEIRTTLTEPPAEIQRVLDIAYNEWETLGGKTLSNLNKFTEWRGKGVRFGWCAGYVTWCMLEAGIPQEELEPIVSEAKASEDTLYHVDGVYHVKEASVGKVLRGYQAMGRATNIPQKGFLVVYGCSFNKTIHLGLVYDVEDLGGGKYRITTLEGNMSSRVKMYIRDYDVNAEVNTNKTKSTNLSEIPEEARVIPESSHVDYSIPMSKPSAGTANKYVYYVNRFLMPWVPGDQALSTPAPTAELTAEPTSAPTAEPTAEPTPAPTAEPTAEPTPMPTAEPTPEAAPEATQETVIVNVTVLTPAPAATAAPEATAVPAAESTQAAEIEATASPALSPAGEATYPCQGNEGNCPYVTRNENDAFCRKCDRNDNGVEDSKE